MLTAWTDPSQSPHRGRLQVSPKGYQKGKGSFGRLSRIIGHPVSEQHVPSGVSLQPGISTRLYYKDDTWLC